ncbi:hypothetical protein NDU88_005648 [Pleurodeles waltl]|uniref:Uncharacterized protein n=1 Tax=Pleurodeles waltl TaxID=8319 RepID=A0AAV7NVU9_PLEWA|nr:hypothetical protein NDU88_005648 [Pleurodeles waltl]
MHFSDTHKDRKRCINVSTSHRILRPSNYPLLLDTDDPLRSVLTAHQTQMSAQNPRAVKPPPEPPLSLNAPNSGQHFTMQFSTDLTQRLKGAALTSVGHVRGRGRESTPLLRAVVATFTGWLAAAQGATDPAAGRSPALER